MIVTSPFYTVKSYWRTLKILCLYKDALLDPILEIKIKEMFILINISKMKINPVCVNTNILWKTVLWGKKFLWDECHC
jgi:hypothetical protein